MSQNAQQIIVVANREPYTHERDEQGQLRIRRAGSGVVNAVEPLLRKCSGVWVGHGAGSADRETALERDGLHVPPDAPQFRLRRVWLSEKEERAYYDGFANSGLWPLCHRTYVQPVFRADDFQTYHDVNHRFACAVQDEAVGDLPIVLVQDYHFGLVPLMIRRRLRSAAVAMFWHIPWPDWQTFATCPWRREILQGLLGSDVLGFQTPCDCFNFVETVDRILGAEIDFGEGVITYRGRRALVRDYPASIQWPGNWASVGPISSCRDAVRAQLHLDRHTLLGVGVDRLDYTKGIEEKFLAIERLLETHRELRGRFVFVQLAEPSRARLAVYRAARLRIAQTMERINDRFGSDEYQPIRLTEARHSTADIARHFRAADVCFVGSLHDGMNLVAKEFVAARDDEQGVLVLSEFAGAANELDDAVIVNPHDVNAAAEALARALAISSGEQRERMRRMRAVVRNHDAHAWARQIMRDVRDASSQAREAAAAETDASVATC